MTMMTKANGWNPINELMGSSFMEQREKEQQQMVAMLKGLSYGRPILKLLIKQYQVVECKHVGEKFAGFSERGLVIDKDQFYTGRVYKFRVRYQWGFYKFTYSFN